MSPRTISRTLVTEARLRHDFERLGVAKGQNLMVHASLSALGFVLGGAPTVVRALIEALEPRGTLCMPAATPRCADPARWSGWEISEEQLPELRENLPLFDVRTTPTSLGVIPETFRNWPGTRRSDHPLESVCARGPLAEEITSDHPLPFSEGEGTPFCRLHDAGGWVLLLGVGFNRCTTLHLAESFVPRRRTTTVRFPAVRNGRREWIEVPNTADDNDTHFPVIGEQYRAAGRARHGSVGEASASLFPMQDIVPFAIAYFKEALR